MDASTLPKDVPALQALVLKQAGLIERQGTLIAKQAEAIKQYEQQVAQIPALKAQIKQLQKMVFGSKGEQRKAINVKKIINQPSNGPSPHGRRRLPEHLLRCIYRYELPASERACPQCQGDLHEVGEQTCEQLALVPAKLYVKSHVQLKYGCRRCRAVLKVAPRPADPIDKGLADGALLADVLINKYQDALPLYRQEQRWKRLGHDIPRSTLCAWVSACADRLEPLVEAMAAHQVLKAPKIHSDDTVVPVLTKDNIKTHTGRLWVYLGCGGQDPPCVVYRYTKTRSGQGPRDFLSGWSGYLQADAYSGYKRLYETGEIIEVSCWAHARRKFIEAADGVAEPTVANEALDVIGQLYAIERRSEHMSAEARYRLRQQEAKPILERYGEWLKAQQETVLPKSPLGKAIAYNLNQWAGLTHYCLDGRLSIDNNAAERLIKPLVLGRKNYLFAGSHEGAKRAAILYSLIETCKLLSINPAEYLQDVLEKLPTTLMKHIDTLLPSHWKAEREATYHTAEPNATCA